MRSPREDNAAAHSKGSFDSKRGRLAGHSLRSG